MKKTLSITLNVCISNFYVVDRNMGVVSTLCTEYLFRKPTISFFIQVNQSKMIWGRKRLVSWVMRVASSLMPIPAEQSPTSQLPISV